MRTSAKIKLRTKQVKLSVEQLVRIAARDCLVITVEQRPLKPLAMGHYETVVEVRPARSKS